MVTSLITRTTKLVLHTRCLACLVACLAAFSSCGQAQNYNACRTNTVDDSAFFVAVDSSFSFINYDSNHLVVYGDSSTFRRFAKKWYEVLTTGQGNVSIMQIGASHVQGGTFPHQIRRNIILGATKALNSEVCEKKGFPVSDRGMIFPYSAAVKCNNPYDYRVSRSHPLTLTRNVYKEPDQQLGLCGIAVNAADSIAEIAIDMSEPDLDFSSRTIVILGQAVGEVTPLVKLPHLGDSLIAPSEVDLNARKYTYHSDTPVDSFRIVMPCDSGESFAITGIYLSNHLPGITYHSIGVNGAAVSDYLAKCPYFVRDLQLCKPDLVIFGIGINDASGPNYDTVIFQKRYLQLVDSIRCVNPNCAFIFITNNDSYRKSGRKYSVNNNGPLVRDAFNRIANACGGAVWDQFTIMGGLKSMSQWETASLAQRDKVHFTRQGYQLLGNMFSNAFFEFLIPLRQNLSFVQESSQKDSGSVNARKNSDTSASKVYKPTGKKKKVKKTAENNTGNERPIYVFE